LVASVAANLRGDRCAKQRADVDVAEACDHPLVDSAAFRLVFLLAQERASIAASECRAARGRLTAARAQRIPRDDLHLSRSGGSLKITAAPDDM
jgi:hypothetical protein